MGSRRLDISSLLCSDPAPADSPTTAAPVPDPVVLAPHLRNPALAHGPLPPPSPPPVRRPPPDLSSDVDQSRPLSDQHRSHAAPRSIDTLIHPPSQPSLRQPADHSRPSSSASFAARSPSSYPYPPLHSPSLSPLVQAGLPPPHTGYSSPSQQRSSASPFFPASQTSPHLHRPTSSHAALTQPRHVPSVSHRSRSNTTSAASPTASLYPLPPSSQNKMGPFAGLEALVHAATEERKRLSAGSPQEPISAPVHSPRHQPPSRSPEDPYRTAQSINSPTLSRPREYPAILPSSHVPHHDSRLPDLRPSPSSSASYPRPPPPISRQQYEEERRAFAQQEHQRRLELQQQKELEQQRLEHQRLREQRLRDEEYREKRIQEERMREQQEEYERRRLEEQQRLEHERLRAEQRLLERRQQERQLEQQRVIVEREGERRRHEEERRMEERRLYEVRLATEERRREEERILQEHIEIRRREEERVLEEQRRREEGRRLEERRLEEQRRLEERMQEEQRRREQRMREEQRRLEELRMDELRRQEEFRHKEEEERRLEQQRLQQEEHERQARLRAEQETQERRALQRQHDSRVSSERPQSAHEGPHHHSFTASTHPLSPHSAPATIELPQPVRPYPPISGPRKSDPIQIKRPVNHDQPSLHISSSAPSSSTDDERPAKKQRFSESPPPSSMEPYPRVVALPPPISTDFLSHRPGSSTVRRPGSGQGRRQPLVGFGDVVERERDKERERERTLADAHRIISSLGRRSPPGSQIGRATAAKKSDEARRADEAAAAAAIADVRKMEGASSPVKKIDDKPHSSTSPARSESRRLSQEHGPVLPRSQGLPPDKIDEPHARKPADDASRKMSLDVVMNNATTDVPVVKKESPLATPLDAPSRSKEQQSKKEAAPRPSRDDRMKPPSSRSSDSHRIVLDAQTLPKKSRDAKETQDAAARQPQHQQDPHEWLLDHYGQPSVHHHSPLEPPRSLSPSTSPVLSKAQTEKARTPPVEIPKPIIALRSPSPDADAALERELAELMAEEDELAPVRKHETDDMDIDLAVAEILEEDDKSKVVPMDVDGADDVEDELLSLVDDRPPPSTTSAVAGRKVATPTLPVAAFKPPPVPKAVDEVKRPSPPAPTLSTVSAATSPVVRPPSTLPASERGSMPPPAVSRGKDRDEDVTKKGESVGATSSQAAKKKKDAGNRNKESATSVNSQPSTNNKPQKVKAAGSKKAKTADGTTIPIPNIAETKTPGAKQAKSSASNKKPSTASHIAASRSRSTSVIPGGSVEPEPEPERKSEEKDEEKDEAIDDKLYCVCKTKYDEDRFMIACDRCDEWYHTTCVNMPDMEVELVDQFFCPPCIEQNPSLNLKTTYKQRCLNGLRHPDPDSSKACHKPARGAISKYCSDECGVEYMQSRIDAWAKKGGKKEELWESVKNSEKREGIAVCVDDKVKSDLDKKKKKQTKMDREMDRLQGLLNQVVKVREEIKTSMEIVVWRERLLQLASERAEHIDQCGWDQRLCFGDDEWQDFGAGVLESYDEVKTIKDENGMQVEDGEEEGEWWCPGQKSCKRHVGWQTLRYKDICKEREKKEELLAKMTNRERQLRKRIDDLTDPNGRKSNSTSQAPLKSSNTKLPNGHAKSRGTTETLKKGKKRKAPAS